MAKIKAPTAGQPADHYMELIAKFSLRPIRTDESHQEARRVLRGLMADTTADAADYKRVLVGLIAAYEREAGHLLDNSDVKPADVVRHLLAERDLSVNAFAKKAGVSQSALNDALTGKRGWSISMIGKVADELGLPRGMFLGD